MIPFVISLKLLYSRQKRLVCQGVKSPYFLYNTDQMSYLITVYVKLSLFIYKLIDTGFLYSNIKVKSAVSEIRPAKH